MNEKALILNFRNQIGDVLSDLLLKSPVTLLNHKI